jgi:hypothetical protein
MNVIAGNVNGEYINEVSDSPTSCFEKWGNPSSRVIVTL